MEDWKGNQIISGHTVSLFRIKTLSSGMFQWMHEGDYDIIQKGEDVYYGIFGQETPIQDMENMVNTPNLSLIVTIKGISDNEEEYFMNYFNA